MSIRHKMSERRFHKSCVESLLQTVLFRVTTTFAVLSVLIGLEAAGRRR